jgi:predicted transcriptional regulator
MGAKLKPKKTEKILHDETRAFELRIKGHSQMEIAKVLGLTQQGVCSILKRVTRKYAQAFLSDVAHIKNEQVSQLENVASEAMAAWYRSKENFNSNKNKINTRGKDGKPALQERLVEERDQYGDPRYLHEFRKAKEDIRKVLGVDLVEKELLESDMVGRIQIEVVGCEVEDKDVPLEDENANAEH